MINTPSIASEVNLLLDYLRELLIDYDPRLNLPSNILRWKRHQLSFRIMVELILFISKNV